MAGAEGREKDETVITDNARFGTIIEGSQKRRKAEQKDARTTEP